MTNVGSSPPSASTDATRLVVVVLPCVPAIAMPWFRRSNSARASRHDERLGPPDRFEQRCETLRRQFALRDTMTGARRNEKIGVRRLLVSDRAGQRNHDRAEAHCSKFGDGDCATAAYDQIGP